MDPCSGKRPSDSNDFDEILNDVAKRLLKNDDIDNLGKALGFCPEETGRYIDTNLRGECITWRGTLHMLRDWRKKQRCSEERPFLKAALEKAGLIRIADDLLSCKRLKSSPGQVPDMTEGDLEQIIEELKHFYMTDLCLVQSDPLNFDDLIEIGQIHTYPDLFRIGKGTGRRERLAYRDLLKTKVNGALVKRLLVEGHGGAGKTTLCAKMAWDWAKGEDFQRFRMVLVVPLRKNKGKTVGEIVKTYLSDSNPVQPHQIDNYILSHPNDVFLIFDGADEFDVDFSSQDEIIRIIRNLRYKSVTVLVTMRPWKAEEIRRYRDLKRVYSFNVIEGFTKEGIHSYIRKFFWQEGQTSANAVASDMSEELIGLIQDSSYITEHIAPFPVYTAMLCVMWKNYGQEKRTELINLQTFSQLFRNVISCLTAQYISKDMETDDDNTNGETDDAIQQLLIDIGKLAFDALLRNQLVFSEEEFASHKELMITCCQIGVLVYERKRSPVMRQQGTSNVGPATVFPHKLFQEYLAGFYLASLYTSDQSAYIKHMNENIAPKMTEHRYLLYFAGSQEEEVALDFISRLNHKDGMKGVDVDFIVDVACECHHTRVSKRVKDIILSRSTTLKIEKPMSTHTVFGYLLAVSHHDQDHMPQEKTLEVLYIHRSCGKVLSRMLGELIASTPSLECVAISDYLAPITLHNDFFSALEKVADCSQIHTLMISEMEHTLDQSASLRLAQFMNKLRCLRCLRIRDIQLHDVFYSSIANVPPLNQTDDLKISRLYLSNRPKASCHLAQFICKLPKLRHLNIKELEVADEFFSTIRSMASAAQLEILDLRTIRLTMNQFFSFASLPKLRSLKLDHVESIPLPKSSSDMSNEDEEVNLVPFLSLTDLTVDVGVLGKWTYGCVDRIFPNVKNGTFIVTSPLSPALLEVNQLPALEDMTIRTSTFDLDYNDPVPLREPLPLCKVLKESFAHVVSITFADLDMGNAGGEATLRGLMGHPNLEKVRFIRCGTDSVRCGTDSVRCGTDRVRCGTDSVRCGTDSVRCGTDSVRCGTDSVRCGTDSVRCGTDIVRCGTDRVRCGTDSVRCGTDSVRCGTDSVRCGTDSERCGTDSERCGTDSERCGTDSVRCGTDSVRCGTDSVRCGTGSERCGTDSVRCGTDSVRCGTDIVRCGTDSERCGTDSVRCGPDSGRCGPDSERCGTDSVRCGTDSERCGTDSVRCGTDSERCGTDSGIDDLGNNEREIMVHFEHGSPPRKPMVRRK